MHKLRDLSTCPTALTEEKTTLRNSIGKSEMYKGVETMAWGSKAPKKGVTSSGADFLAELKRKEAP